MSLPIPNLDDRSFDDLLQEAKSLIPIYNKDWTNHNPSDPGITLVELFSWLSEMTIYRISQTSEDNYRVFLKLLGISYVFRWDGVPGIDNNRLCDFMTQNYGITLLPPVKIEKSADDQSILISDSNDNISVRLVRDQNKVIINVNNGVNDEFEAKSEYLFSWHNVPGSDENRFLEYINETFEMAKTAKIEKSADGATIFINDGGKITSLTLNQSQDYVTVNSYQGIKSQLIVTKKDDQLKIHRLKIYWPITKDIQRGLAALSQCYRAITTADFETLTLEALSKLQSDLSGRVTCMMNRDLAYSKSNPDAEKPGHVSVILLVSGEKPVFCWDDLPGRDNNKLIDFLLRIYGIDWVTAASITKSTDGMRITISKESGSESILLNRISDDKVSLVCPGFLPDELVARFEETTRKTALYAYGTGGANPSGLLIRQIYQYLTRRKLVGTRIHVVAADYYPVKIQAKIILNTNTNPDTIIQSAITAVKKYFDPLKGGDSGTGWPLGRSIYRSEIYRLLEGIPGVDHVTSLLFDGKATNQIAILPHQLIDPNSQIIIEVFS